MIIREKDKRSLLEISDKVIKTSVEIWVYGSRVNGEAHDTSDLDLVIRTKDLQRLKNSELYDFEEAVEQSNIPIIVQIFDWARIPQSFQNNILKKYEMLKK